jgi:hypothetical protein
MIVKIKKVTLSVVDTIYLVWNGTKKVVEQQEKDSSLLFDGVSLSRKQEVI